jgi:geranylgeranyl diphosphate synthase type II
VAVDRMIAGEYVDTEFEGKPISSDYLEYMHTNKTGALLKLCARIGAILADSPEQDLEYLTKYAEKIGLAFQIKDDILSEEGDELITGKPVGNDREKHKCTYVTKFGLEESKKLLNQIIEEAIEIVEKYGDKGEFLKALAIYIKDRNK